MMNQPSKINAGSTCHGLPGRKGTGSMPVARAGITGSMPVARGVRRRAFTLAEILVVVAILALLIGVVYKGGSTLMNNAKARDTEALIKTLMAAVEAYKLEVNDSNIPYMKDVYLGNPPDSVYLFDRAGLPLPDCSPYSPANPCTLRLVSASSSAVAPPGLKDVRNPSNGQLQPLARSTMRHEDIRALVLSIRLRSPKAAEILDRIDPRFKVAGEVAYDPGDGSAPIPLDYYADSWGIPLEYFSMCTGELDPDPRRQVAKRILHLNNGSPLIVSYGPNGPDQISADFMGTYGDTTIVGDMYDNNVDMRINHELNHDNVYSDPAVIDRLRRGGP